MTRRTNMLFILGAVLVVALAAADVFTGQVRLDGSELSRTVFWHIRAPRILIAILAGASLSLAGAQMQAIFRNPLADPHIMGISGGAGLGAAIATAGTGSALTAGGSILSGIPVTAAAFAGAVLTTILIIGISSRIRSNTTLLVFGVMLGFIFSAIISIIEYSTSEESLKAFYGWSAGSFTSTGATAQWTIAVALAAGICIALAVSKGLDLSLFGEEYASLAGSNTSLTRNLSLTGCCLVTGAVTAFCGPIGFVGIIAPHITRALSGTSRHAAVLPLCMVTGAAISLCADILSNVWSTPLPVGSTMALIGIPIVIYILLKK